MSPIIIILIVIVLLIALILLLALFTKREYTIGREIIISKSTQEVFDYVKVVKNQNIYNKWWTADPNAIKEYTGADGTVGFIAAWDSDNKKVGKGEEEIKKITEGERIDFEIRFIKPFEGVANAYMSTEAVSENSTKLQWVFNSSMKYPMNIMLLILNFDKMMGKDMEASLATLKSALEK